MASQIWSAEYIAEIRFLTLLLDDMLRDRFLCEISGSQIQNRLLSEGTWLTLQKAVDISLSMEGAAHQAELISGSPIEVIETSAHKVEQKPHEKERYHCGGRYSPDSCSFKTKNRR